MKLLIKNGRVVDPSQKLDEICDVLVADGKIAKVAKNITDKADETYDAAGKVVAPGFIDMHTHLREPGLEAKESIRTGTMAAAAGAPACLTRNLLFPLPLWSAVSKNGPRRKAM